MADIVASTELVKSSHKSAFVFSNQSDGTGEASVKKIVIANLPGAPKRVRISHLAWSVSDGASVQIKFDRTLATPSIIVNGSGNLACQKLGPIEDKLSGLTGDIEFTFVNAVASGGYVIEMEVEAVKE